MSGTYRGRLAPSPTGLLHLGHARTFRIAQRRSQERGGTLALRSDDLDRARVRPEYVQAMIEDLRWLGFDWQEGPDVGGPYAPYVQSERMAIYRSRFEALKSGGLLYPCRCSRAEIARALSAPHEGEEEPIYPRTCLSNPPGPGDKVNWRFKVSDGQSVRFADGGFGEQEFVAGRDFGDFVVWRSDDLPAYQLACAVDDASMEITEVVRGADLLASTVRQLLIFDALGLPRPEYFHCPLVLDQAGVRLAKRHDALSLRTLREAGSTPDEIRTRWNDV